MDKIIRSHGTTESEKYLALLADRTFLNLWSYPNPYRDTIVNGLRAGKELCDLLVVCGNHIIIFSVKENRWKPHKNIDIAWSRWYRRAIKESIRQLRRAEKWVSKFPNRIFIDVACTKNLPIQLPQPNNRKIHLVMIALGAHKACSEFFSGDCGSFMIRPQLIGDAHLNPSSPEYSPFTIGEVDSSRSFIHVMNDVTLDIIMKELDTITDFTDFLDAKVSFIRSGHLLSAAGEEELLAYYLTHMADKNKHGFAHPDNRPWASNDFVAFDKGFWARLQKNPQHIRKKKVDRNSYIWDFLIERFTNHMLAGTAIVPDGQPLNIDNLEIGVRHMAQEPRLMRRLYGDGILSLLEIAHEQDRSFRAMIPTFENPKNDTGYAFMILAHPKWKLAGGYEQYRKVRINMLQTYCFSQLKKFNKLKQIIGIAMEPPPNLNDARVFSEDLILIEQPSEWTPQLEADLIHDCKIYNIMQEDRIRTYNMGVDEYPDEKISS